MRGKTARCKIGVLQGDIIKSVYCHQEAFPEVTGILLRDNYDLAKTLQLLEHGDLSYLGKTLQDCNFYARDRHVDLQDCCVREYDSTEKFLSIGAVDYFYLLKDDGWHVISSEYVDNYKVIPNFMTIDDALLVKAQYRKAEVKVPRW
jgi:hypothetical protein